jgi:poly-gamma-glutamate synthesis protein (capsule biosynthesis protein)
VSLAFTGDILPHSPLWRQAAENAAATGRNGFDFGPMLAGLSPVFQTVDAAICHLETPIAPQGEEYSTSPRYGVPAEIADAIAAVGYTRCSTASNHTLDRGTAGIDRTVGELQRVGLTQTGMARRPDEITPTVIDVDGVALTHLSYTWSFNGLTLPADESWRAALIDPERIIDEARTARGMGAEVVVVSLHWGAEGVHHPTRSQRDIAEQLTASGLIDLIVGHHAHVVQPIEQINGTWVVFGLGNILSNLPTSNRWPAASQDAVVVTVEITVDGDDDVVVGRPVVIPTWVDKEAGWIVRVVDTELSRDDLSAGQRDRLERSRERTADVLGDYIAEDTSR